MKKLLIVSSLLIISFFDSYGQWYVKKYQVSDISFLSKSQLDESLVKSKKDLLTSGCIAGFGGVFFIVFKYLKPGMSDDPSFIEQLIGNEGVNKIGMAAGIGMLAGGAIASVVYAGRVGTIKSVINSNYPSYGTLNISPTVISIRNTRSSSPGIRITCNF